MRPSAVQAVFVIVPLGIAVCAVGTQRLAAYRTSPESPPLLGRCLVIIGCRVLGVSALLAMTRIDPARRLLLLSVYVVRSWLMNCHSGLSKAVLNDHVMRRNRGVWNALESLNAFGWSGSALLGGYLVDKWGYEATFVATASLQALSVVPFVALQRLVPPELPAPP